MPAWSASVPSPYFAELQQRAVAALWLQWAESGLQQMVAHAVAALAAGGMAGAGAAAESHRCLKPPRDFRCLRLCRASFGAFSQSGAGCPHCRTLKIWSPILGPSPQWAA